MRRDGEHKGARGLYFIVVGRSGERSPVVVVGDEERGNGAL